MRLSPHFTLTEATKSQTALRLGIHNAAPPEVIPALGFTAERILEPVRRHFNRAIVPSSWFRSVPLNEALGGAGSHQARLKNPNSQPSQHMSGEAVDFEVPAVPNPVLAKWIRENIEFDQLILEFHDGKDPYSGWVHCSAVAHRPMRRMFIEIN